VCAGIACAGMAPAALAPPPPPPPHPPNSTKLLTPHPPSPHVQLGLQRIGDQLIHHILKSIRHQLLKVLSGSMCLQGRWGWGWGEGDKPTRWQVRFRCRVRVLVSDFTNRTVKSRRKHYFFAPLPTEPLRPPHAHAKRSPRPRTGLRSANLLRFLPLLLYSLTAFCAPRPSSAATAAWSAAAAATSAGIVAALAAGVLSLPVRGLR